MPSKTMIMVISLLMLAGGMGVSASFSKNTLPDRESIRIACAALVSKRHFLGAGNASQHETHIKDQVNTDRPHSTSSLRL